MVHLFRRIQGHPHHANTKRSSIIKRYLSPLLGITLFIISLWALYKELHEYPLEDLIRSLHIIPMGSLVLSLALTVASYVIKTGYDYYSLRIVGRSLPYPRIAGISFIGFVLANSAGLSVIPDAAVRYRLYSPHGLTGFDITKIVFFLTVLPWLGFILLSTVIFFLMPIILPPQLHLPFRTDYPISFLMLIPVMAIIVVAVFWKGSLTVGGLEISMPPLQFFIPLIFIAMLDWIVASSVLFVILPSGISFWIFLSIFMIAQLVAGISQIPAGLGVFDAAIVLFLARDFPAYSILASLIVYRAMYYLLPLLPTIVMLAIEEATE